MLTKLIITLTAIILGVGLYVGSVDEPLGATTLETKLQNEHEFQAQELIDNGEYLQKSKHIVGDSTVQVDTLTDKFGKGYIVRTQSPQGKDIFYKEETHHGDGSVTIREQLSIIEEKIASTTHEIR